MPSLTIVLSAGQSRSPEKRGLEEQIVQAASQWQDVCVVVVPHLYDLVAEGPSVQKLRQVQGPLVLLSWLYERAGHWVLDRLGVHGRLEPTELSEQEDDEADTVDRESHADIVPKKSNRIIHSIDLRSSQKVEDFTNELRRLADWHQEQSLAAESVVTIAASEGSQPKQLSMANLFLGDLEASIDTVDELAGQWTSPPMETVIGNLHRVEEHPTRRWYPVIDFSRCTNCMECIDFCLFGVYGVDASERILVEQPDNCRKGCPACSRVCPANAIMFPQHKTPAIAGAPAGDSSFKIDLSKLFGAPESDEDAAAVAARERDEHLILAGRPAVGMPVKEEASVPMRTAAIRAKWSADQPKDGLDQLIDQLDELDL